MKIVLDRRRYLINNNKKIYWHTILERKWSKC